MIVFGHFLGIGQNSLKSMSGNSNLLNVVNLPSDISSLFISLLLNQCPIIADHVIRAFEIVALGPIST